MKKFFIASASVLALSAGAAFAQTSGQSNTSGLFQNGTETRPPSIRRSIAVPPTPRTSIRATMATIMLPPAARFRDPDRRARVANNLGRDPERRHPDRDSHPGRHQWRTTCLDRITIRRHQRGHDIPDHAQYGRQPAIDGHAKRQRRCGQRHTARARRHLDGHSVWKQQ